MITTAFFPQESFAPPPLATPVCQDAASRFTRVVTQLINE